MPGPRPPVHQAPDTTTRPRRLLSIGLTCWALSWAMIATALASPGDDAQACIRGSGQFDLDVAFCSRAIRDTTHSKPTLAALHVARARAYRRGGRAERARADLDAALALNPFSASAHDERGLAWRDEGKHLTAIEDFDRAIALFPRYASAYRHRGISRYFLGDAARAVADLDRAIEIDPHRPESHAFRGFASYLRGDYAAAARSFDRVQALGYPYPYTVLWLHLSRLRQGSHARGELSAFLKSLDENEWPRPLVELYLRHGEAEDVLEYVGGLPDRIRKRRSTEASFYAGELWLASGHAGRTERAERWLKSSAGADDGLAVESVIARFAVTSR